LLYLCFVLLYLCCISVLPRRLCVLSYISISSVLSLLLILFVFSYSCLCCICLILSLFCFLLFCLALSLFCVIFALCYLLFFVFNMCVLYNIYSSYFFLQKIVFLYTMIEEDELLTVVERYNAGKYLPKGPPTS